MDIEKNEMINLTRSLIEEVHLYYANRNSALGLNKAGVILWKGLYR